MTRRFPGAAVAAAVVLTLLMVGPPSASGVGSPNLLSSVEGVNMLDVFTDNVSPSDSTGAMGPTRYIELVNHRFAVYDRAWTVMESGFLQDIVGLPSARLVDSEVMWSPDQQRFFYSMIDTNADFSSSALAFGFSKSPEPDVEGWCSYTSTFGVYGSEFPDFPRLGDTADFVLMGVNRFSAHRAKYRASDLAWYAKPTPGVLTTCPAMGSFATGIFTSLTNVDGKALFTPVPVKQVDVSETGYVLGVRRTHGTRDRFSMMRLTPNGSGQPDLGSAETVFVPQPFSEPPPAPQGGTPYLLETLDARFTQAVAALDPLRLDPQGNPIMAIWTQHTVAAGAGGLGSEIRWYEVDPSTNGLLQSGAVHSPSLYVFNGGISPDRAVSEAGVGFGSSMVLGFDTSSETTFVAIQMVSKVGDLPQSGFVLVQHSPGPNVDTKCFKTPPCRWGDYAMASPDPAAPLTGSRGIVRLTNTWTRDSPENKRIDWRTVNWAASP